MLPRKGPTTKYLIIGNSAGGIGAAEAIRSVDHDGPLTIISEEPYPAYSRPLLTQYLSGERTLEQILFRPSAFYEQKGIDLRLGHRAVRLDIESHQVEMENGERLSYEKLLLAPGSLPLDPDVAGRERRGVFNFHSLGDALSIAQALPRARRVVVLGGGLIALSTAKALVHRGLDVTLVVRSNHVLSTMLDEAGSKLVEATLKERGVQVITRSSGEEIAGRPDDPGAVGDVHLGRGARVPASLVVLARGVTPRLELAKGTTIRTNRGILVDRHLATSVPSIYACGDATEAYDTAVAAIWLNAYVGGRVAGLNMAGRPTDYPSGTGMSCLDALGLPVVSAGLVAPRAEDSYQVLSQLQDKTYQKLVVNEGRVVGMILIGDVRRSGLYYGLMRNQIDVTPLGRDLLAPDFDLAHLSPELRKSVLASAEPRL